MSWRDKEEHWEQRIYSKISFVPKKVSLTDKTSFFDEFSHIKHV
jgi:hypothetical protein